MAWCLFLSPSLGHSSDGCRIVRYPVSSVIEALWEVMVGIGSSMLKDKTEVTF